MIDLYRLRLQGQVMTNEMYKEVAHELFKTHFSVNVIFTASKQTEIASYFLKKF